MSPTESFAPWMGKRAHMPEISADMFTRKAHFDDAKEKAQGEWVQDELPFDEAPTTPLPEPISEEPKMEKTATTTTIPVKHTKAYPKKSKKPTAPGTKPKRK